jgi:hypothetical protein
MTDPHVRAKRYLAFLFCFGAAGALAAAQAPDRAAPPANTTGITRLPPLPRPPVAFFRNLLALSPGELDKTLAEVTGSIRTNLLAKLREYAALTADEREARLRATEFEWYLGPLMRTPATNRVAQLALVPDEYRPFVKDSLERWDALPPGVQTDFLRIQSASTSERENTLRSLSSGQRKKLEEELASWSSLPSGKRERMYDNFQRFFELPPRERERTLDALSDAERQEMENTLRIFEKLPPAQRLACIASFRKFTEMTPAEREQFLKNAGRWKELSPADRQTWRTLVTKLPPLPPGFGLPPLPPSAGQKSRPPLPPGTIILTNLSR